MNDRIPRASIVMAAYNTATTIGPAISSVLNQTESSFELIVVDDGSTDATPDVVRSFADPRIRLISGEHGGAAVARNAGVQASRGSAVGFVDSDDLLMPRYLEVVLSTIESDRGVGFVHTDAYMLEDASGRVRRAVAMAADRPALAPGTADELHLALLRTNFIYNATTVPREVFDRLGGFDESLAAGIDYEMWLRIAAHGYRAARAPGVLAVYRWGRRGSISADRERVLSNLVRVFEIAAEQHPGSEQARELARGRLTEVEAELARVRRSRGGRGVLLRVRDVLVRARKRRYTAATWYPRADLPTELSRAFPDLGATRPR